MQIKKSKGFTIIELIVVIAIIAILASIVLVNVTTYINKAKAAAVKSDISSIALGMGTCYAENLSYASCTIDATLSGDITKQGGTLVTTATPTTAYCASSTLPGGGTICVDSTGVTSESKVCTTATSVCATP
ncbi:MAG: prepilin-type N-terminal cleavage/methylation domain-containing protein [Candidatus Staskawiczbacteria bacterium]|nr:prepilin-type N-terminal cleavage/methylation domain-containing protein [Candidatus Staskawiczbacteria bacterium]